jgi:hypothetical protein
LAAPSDDPPSLIIFSDGGSVDGAIVDGGSTHRGTVPFHRWPSQPKTGSPINDNAGLTQANLTMAPPYSSLRVTALEDGMERAGQPGLTQLGTVRLHTPSCDKKHS